MGDFLEEYGFAFIMTILIYILVFCGALFFTNLKLNNEVNVKQEQIQNKELQSDNNVKTEHHLNILNSMKHVVKTVGMIIGICILLIVNILLIMKDFMQYNTLSQKNKTYYFRKSTMEFNPMDINYDQNFSIVLH